MAILPNPNFPILESDQAEIIQLFLELMGAMDRIGRTETVATDLPITQGYDSNGAWNSDEPRGLD